MPDRARWSGRWPGGVPSGGGLPQTAWTRARKRKAWRKGARPGVALPDGAVAVCRYPRCCFLVVRPPPPAVVRSAPIRGGAAAVPAGGWSRGGRQRRRASCAGGRCGQTVSSTSHPATVALRRAEVPVRESVDSLGRRAITRARDHGGASPSAAPSGRDLGRYGVPSPAGAAAINLGTHGSGRAHSKPWTHLLVAQWIAPSSSPSGGGEARSPSGDPIDDRGGRADCLQAGLAGVARRFRACRSSGVAGAGVPTDVRRRPPRRVGALRTQRR